MTVIGDHSSSSTAVDTKGLKGVKKNSATRLIPELGVLIFTDALLLVRIPQIF
jgi:hypothetical protein